MSGYDPKLKQAMTEIEAVCKKYDCGGHIFLVSPTHTEYRFSLPEWTAFTEELDPTGAVVVRLRVNKAEMGPAVAKRKAELTAHFLWQMRDQAATLFGFCERMIEMTKGKWDVTHNRGKLRPHRPEEN